MQLSVAEREGVPRGDREEIRSSWALSHTVIQPGIEQGIAHAELCNLRDYRERLARRSSLFDHLYHILSLSNGENFRTEGRHGVEKCAHTHHSEFHIHVS